MSIATEIWNPPATADVYLGPQIPTAKTDSSTEGSVSLDRRGRIWAGAASALGPAVVVASVLFSTKDLSRGPVVCPLRLLVGIPCPFCGMTTSFAHVGGLRLREAFLANPAGPLLYAAVLVGSVVLLAIALSGRYPRLHSSLPRWVRPAVQIASVIAVAMMWSAELLRFGII